MSATTEIPEIIKSGKLKSYQVSQGFLQVYWSHPDLPENSYYLFVFTASTGELIKVNVVSPPYIPVKQNPKRYVPFIERLMKSIE